MDLTGNALVRPAFASRGPARIHLDPRTVAPGLAMVTTLASLFFLIGLPVTVTLCSGLSGCSFPTVRTAGVALDLAGALIATGGCVLMYRLNPAGRALAVYGLVLLALGGVVALVGNDIFVGANSSIYTAGNGAVVFLVVQLVAVAILYSLVVMCGASAPPADLRDGAGGAPADPPTLGDATPPSLPPGLSTAGPRTGGNGRRQSTPHDPAGPG